MLSFCPIPIAHSLDRALSIPDVLVDPWQQVARRVRSTPDGGEPHYKCAAAKSGKGLSRESLKDIFAAAPCSRSTIEGSFKPRVEPACVPRASRLSERHILQRFFGADMRASYNAECNPPPNAVAPFLLLRRLCLLAESGEQSLLLV